MTAPLWAGLVLLAFGAAAIWLPKLPPRRALAVLVLAAAAGLTVARLVALAVPLAAIGLGLWRSAGPVRQAAPSPGGRSEVGTARLRMTLDHATGAMDGEITAGAFAGARLSGLAPADLQRLLAECEDEGDADSRALILAWLDRQGRRPEQPEPPGPAPGPMTEAEAYRVLGLAPGASAEEIRAAYRRLIRRVHPDLGGSDPLAALLNAAIDRLDPK